MLSGRPSGARSLRHALLRYLSYAKVAVERLPEGAREPATRNASGPVGHGRVNIRYVRWCTGIVNVGNNGPVIQRLLIGVRICPQGPILIGADAPVVRLQHPVTMGYHRPGDEEQRLAVRDRVQRAIARWRQAACLTDLTLISAHDIVALQGGDAGHQLSVVGVV